MGPLTLDQFREKLAPQHSERKLATLGQLWEVFHLRCVFVDSTGANTFAATAVGDLGIGPLREIGGMLSIQLAPFREVTGVGVKERPDSVSPAAVNATALRTRVDPSSMTVSPSTSILTDAMVAGPAALSPQLDVTRSTAQRTKPQRLCIMGVKLVSGPSARNREAPKRS